MLTWLLVIIALIGTVLNVRHDRRGFVLWAISNLGLAIVNARSSEWAQASLWMIYVVLAVWGWLAWSTPYRRVMPVGPHEGGHSENRQKI